MNFSYILFIIIFISGLVVGLLHSSPVLFFGSLFGLIVESIIVFKIFIKKRTKQENDIIKEDDNLNNTNNNTIENIEDNLYYTKISELENYGYKIVPNVSLCSVTSRSDIEDIKIDYGIYDKDSVIKVLLNIDEDNHNNKKMRIRNAIINDAIKDKKIKMINMNQNNINIDQILWDLNNLN